MVAKITAFFTAVITFLAGIIPHPLTPFVPAEINPPVQEETEMMTLIENNSSDYVIVRAADASPSVVTAAATLQNYLQRISGTTLAVVTDETAVAQKEILVGPTNRAGVSYPAADIAYGVEEVHYFTSGNALVFLGGAKRGVLYGVYCFLEEQLGCKWYTKDLIVVPEKNKVEIAKNLNVSEKSPLEYRETDWISPKNVAYSVANKLNSNIYRYLSAENGGSMGYTGSGFAHTLTTRFVASSKYFATNPEYYALQSDGKRSPNQLCLTNPDVLNIIIKEVIQQIKDYPENQIVSVTQHDNQDYCRCEKCKAIDDEEGSHSGTMIRFVNSIADAVKQAGYDDVAIDTFAYQYTRKAPKTTVPRDNVIVRLCSIECCFAHPLNDPDCAQNVDFCADLEDWARISNRLYVWDYTTNYGNYIGPFPDFQVLQANIKFFAENSVVGLYEEGNYTASDSDAEFAELRAYLLAKLMWNPNIDLDAEINGFMQAYYGEGWQYVKEYVRYTGTQTGLCNRHMTIYRPMTDKSVLDLNKYEIDYLNNLWVKAKELADTPAVLEHVCRSELSWRYWKACNKRSEFSRLQKKDNWISANEEFYNDLVKFGIARICEGDGGKLDPNPDFTSIPSKWRVKW